MKLIVNIVCLAVWFFIGLVILFSKQEIGKGSYFIVWIILIFYLLMETITNN